MTHQAPLTKVHPLKPSDAPLRAQQLIPVLRGRAAETDRLAKFPDATVQDLERLGLFRLSFPQVYGGEQIDPRTFMDTIVNLGRGDMSVAWATSILNGCTAMVASTMPEHVVDTMFSTAGGPRVAGIFASRSLKTRPEGRGVLIEDGTWAFNSGVHHANWDLLSVPIYDKDGAVVDEGLALVPISQVEILDDWDTIGLRGTGSNTIRVRNVYVESDWILPFGRVRRENYIVDRFRDIWSLRISPTAFGAIVLTYPAIGAAEAALELFREKASKGGIQYTQYTKRSDAPSIHLLFGEASARIEAAKTLAYKAVDEMSSAAKAGIELDVMHNARIRRDTGIIGRLLWEAVDLLASGSGGSFIASSNLLNRCWKDIRAGNMHGAITPPTVLEYYGRLAFGLSSNMTLAGLGPSDPQAK